MGGWPGSGKTTLARALAAELDFDYLSMLTVDTTEPVDVPALAARVRAALATS